MRQRINCAGDLPSEAWYIEIDDAVYRVIYQHDSNAFCLSRMSARDHNPVIFYEDIVDVQHCWYHAVLSAIAFGRFIAKESDPDWIGKVIDAVLESECAYEVEPWWDDI